MYLLLERVTLSFGRYFLPMMTCKILREYWMREKDLDQESQDICHSKSPFTFWQTHLWTAQVTWWN
jgi:hypothetical protein